MARRDEMDELMFSLQTCLNQLIAFSDEAEKVITFHKTLLQWELKADNLRTAYSFAKSIVWKTIEHDFYLYVYSQLSGWLRSAYENAGASDISPRLQSLLRRLKGVIHTCVGLDLPSVMPHYRKLLNECEGCENGLDSVTFDETTIETQTLQLLEQTALELGHDIKLFDRLGELSRAGSVDQVARPIIPGTSTSVAHPPVEETRPQQAPQTTTTAFPAFPTSGASAEPAVSVISVPSAPPPKLSVPRHSAFGLLAGPVGPGSYQSPKGLGVSAQSQSAPGPFSSRGTEREPDGSYANIEQTKTVPVAGPPKVETAAPVTTKFPSLPGSPSSDESREATRPFGFHANAAFFQERDRATRSAMVSEPPADPLARRTGQKSQSEFPQQPQIPSVPTRGPTPDRSPLAPSLSDSAGFFKQVEQRALQANQPPSFRPPQKTATESDDRARADSFDDNVSTTFTDLQFDNRETSERPSAGGQIYTSLTDVTGLQNTPVPPQRETEVETPLGSETRQPVHVERVDSVKAEGSRSNIVTSKTISGTKMPKSTPHKRNHSHVIQTGKMFSPEESMIEIPSDYPEHRGPTRRLSTTSDSSTSTILDARVPVVASHRSRRHSKPVYVVHDRSRPKSRSESAQFTIIMKPDDEDKMSRPSRADSYSSSSSTSGRGNSRSSSSSSSTSSTSSSSSSSSSARRKTQKHRSPTTLIKIEPLVFETMPRKKVMRSIEGSGRNVEISQMHCHKQPHCHRHGFEPHQQRRRFSPVGKIVVENCEPEFETCPHIESGHASNEDNCQSSVVLRHVCKKCQKDLEKGRPLIRRNSVGGYVQKRPKSQSRHRPLTVMSPVQPPPSRGQSKGVNKRCFSPAVISRGHCINCPLNETSGSEDEQVHIGKGEIFANKAFMKCYQLHHRRHSLDKNKSMPLFTVRSISDLKQNGLLSERVC
uniref:SCA7 domain-containing protein n=2 Tax=Mesocestoides corti TaxID=53468 RepID=A0A5K3F2W2_MESCO